MNVQPFPPVGNAYLVAPTSTSSSTNLSAAETAVNVIRIYNAGSVAVAYKATIGAGTAVYPVTTGSTVIPPGSVEVFSKGNADTISFVTSSAAGSVIFQCGEGQ